MSSIVSVVGNGGRRVTLHVTANTSLHEVLERSCAKLCVSVHEHTLTHHNRPLDLSCPLRLSGLPNRALLELSDTPSCTPLSDVTVAVQLEDGGRRVGEFSDCQTIWHVLSTLDLLCHQKQDSVYVCVYAGRQVVGEQELGRVSLARLGIRGGSKAVLRLLVRSADHVPATQAHEATFLAHRDKIAHQSDSLVVDEVSDCGGKVTSEQNSLPLQDKCGSDALMQCDEDSSLPSVVTTDCNSTNTSQPVATPDDNNKPHNERVLISEQSSSSSCTDYLDQRRSLIFSMDEAAVEISHQHAALPDDFFDITIEDVRSRHRWLKEQAATAAEGAPLITRALRQSQQHAQQLQLLANYRQCVLRVHFERERLVLQLLMASVDTVQSLVDAVSVFVHHCHERQQDHCRGFRLFLAEPQRRILQSAHTLLQEGCVPAARLHILAEENCQVRLQPQFAARLSHPSVANSLMENVRRRCTTKNSGKRSHSQTPGSVPKWFNTNQRR